MKYRNSRSFCGTRDVKQQMAKQRDQRRPRDTASTRIIIIERGWVCFVCANEWCIVNFVPGGNLKGTVSACGQRKGAVVSVMYSPHNVHNVPSALGRIHR